MPAFNRYDLEGCELEKVDIEDQWLKASVKPQLIKDYIKAILANRRQWSANTKGRSEVAHSNRKVQPQKGTGGARHGGFHVAQFRGGATVFGAKPKFDQRVRMNKKEKKGVIRAILANKFQAGAVVFVRLSGLEEVKTKKMVQFLNKMGSFGEKNLFLGECDKAFAEDRRKVYLSLRNLPKASFMPVQGVSGYDLMHHDRLFISERAIDHIEKIFKGG